MKRQISLILALALSGCGEASSDKVPIAAQPVIVRVANVSALPSTVPIVGKVRAAQQAVLFARVPASVSAVEPLGGSLAAGQPPVTLVAPEITARLAAARAEAARLQADLAREERLLKEGAAAPEVVRSLRQQSAAAASMADEAAAHAALLAPSVPFAGKVLRSTLRVGDTVAPGTLLAEVASEDSLIIEIEVPLTVPLVTPGGALLISSGGKSYQATLVELAPAGGLGMRVRAGRLALAVSTGLRPGDAVRVDWPSVGTPLVIVPEASISRRSQLEQAIVIREGRAELRLVRTAGSAGEGMVAVATGLNAGEIVVTSAEAPLRDGSPVEVRR